MLAQDIIVVVSIERTDPQEQAPDVTVIVAAYNEEKLLPRCLDSLARLSGPERVEVIVVDNGSSDRTVEIAQARGVRVLHEANRGAVHAKAAGARAANGALVAVLDADSVCPPDWVSRIVAAFQRDPRLVGLTGPARYIGGRFWVRPISALWYFCWRAIGLVAGRSVYAVGTNVAFRREAYERSTGFDTGVLVGGDEVSLFSALSKHGRTRYDPMLVVDTDGRRMQMGFLRFSFEIVLLHYCVNYSYYRLTGRSLLRRYRPGSTLR